MSTPARTVEPNRPTAALAVARLGVVSFLNTRPIISGLESRDDLELIQAVPSLLLDHLLEDAVDVALCSSVDYLRSPVPLKALRVAPLTSDGATLTVRVFSAVPLTETTRVHCDTDSHTSVALLRILMRDHWSVDPDIVEFDARSRGGHWPETVMLIGDKVVQDAPSEQTHPHHVDLGEAWKQMTGLPFVFAIWMARADACTDMLGTVSRTLADQLEANLQDLDRLVEREAGPRGWSVEMAMSYLNGLIRYRLGPRELKGLETFLDRATAHGLAVHARPLDFFEG